MWKLKSTKKEHWDHYIFVDEDCIVGRKDSTLLISNDPSVSRKHAVLSVRHPEENIGFPSRKSSLFMRDEGSKYGTFKNGVRLTNEEQLSEDDIIKFGQFESEFRIYYEPLIVTTSCLDIVSKNKLKKVIQKLGGHLVSEWQPACTHLVMSLVKVTIKALCCLVSLKSIVLPEYFEELYEKLKSSASTIPASRFIPPIGESLIDKDSVSFDVNLQRKNLFKNKTFFFLDDKQFKKLHLGIMMGGGKASMLSEDQVDLDLLSYENTCFIEPTKGELKEETNNLLKEILNNLQKKNFRMIPESDIGLAVVYASTEKFCNPSFNVGSAVLGSQKIPSQTLTEREVYVPDTQESVQRPKSSMKKFSLASSNSEPKFKKQKIEAPDSLTFPSSRADDPEDVFEIPLSAQVKQELDDIFDITMKELNENAEEDDDEMPSTLPAEPMPEPEVETMHAELKEKERSKKTISYEEPKIKKKPTLVEEDEFTSFAMDNDDQKPDKPENLPRNLATVKFVSLIVRKPVFSSQQKSIYSGVKNFKKFKKVLPIKVQALPIIIGGRDLVPYDKNAAKLAEQSWDDEPGVISSGPIKGAFDWDSQKA